MRAMAGGDWSRGGAWSGRVRLAGARGMLPIGDDLLDACAVAPPSRTGTWLWPHFTTFFRFFPLFPLIGCDVHFRVDRFPRIGSGDDAKSIQFHTGLQRILRSKERSCSIPFDPVRSRQIPMKPRLRSTANGKNPTKSHIIPPKMTRIWWIERSEILRRSLAPS